MMRGKKQLVARSGETSGLTLHHQVEASLLKYLTGGKVQVGSKLPPEVELCEELQVSRNTLRMALNRLEQEGYLLRKKRVGTIVIRTARSPSFAVDFSSTEKIRDYLRRTKFEDRSVSRTRIPSRIQRIAELESEGLWLRISGVRTERVQNPRVVAEVQLYVHPDYVEEVDHYGQAADFLYETIERRHSERVGQIEFRLVPINIPARSAEKMHLEPGTVSLNLIEVVRRRDGIPIEVASIVFSPTVVFSFSLSPSQ